MHENSTVKPFDDARIGALFAAIDEMNTEAFAAFLAPQVSFRFGNAEAVEGRAAVAEAVGGFFDSIQALSHVIDKILRDGPCVVCEGRVTYTRHDASRLSVPFLNLFELDRGLIQTYRIYVDASALYAA